MSETGTPADVPTNQDTAPPSIQPEMQQEIPDPQSNQPQEARKKPNIQFSIWPPTQRTRDAVTNRLIETLSTPSVLSKRYGTVPQEEAVALAKQIEDEAFSGASGAASAEDDGIEILQVYSKEISKRMLEIVKARASASASSVEKPNTDAPEASEEISPSAVTES